MNLRDEIAKALNMNSSMVSDEQLLSELKKITEERSAMLIGLE